MFSVRALLLPIFLLLGFAAVVLLPSGCPAAPAAPNEAVGDLSREDVVAPETGHEGANRNLAQETFDEDQPPPDANCPRPEQLFDEEQPPRDANCPRPEKLFDEDQPPHDANCPRPEHLFDEDQPPPGPNRPRPERPFDEERPRLSSNPSTGPVEIRYGSAELRVDVFDVTGRRIATLTGAGGSASWDGRNTNGASVSRGIYFARVISAREGFPKVVRITRR
jgi:hypothetical protein